MRGGHYLPSWRARLQTGLLMGCSFWEVGRRGRTPCWDFAPSPGIARLLRITDGRQCRPEGVC